MLVVRQALDFSAEVSLLWRKLMNDERRVLASLPEGGAPQGRRECPKTVATQRFIELHSPSQLR